jgi:hypothetical protein
MEDVWEYPVTVKTFSYGKKGEVKKEKKYPYRKSACRWWCDEIFKFLFSCFFILYVEEGHYE